MKEESCPQITQRRSQCHLREQMDPMDNFAVPANNDLGLRPIRSGTDLIQSADKTLRPAKSLAVSGAPWYTAHVIATFFPEAGLVVFKEPHTLNPLG